MINFIKNDKYFSIINIMIILVFLMLDKSYVIFLLIELLFLSLYMLYITYRTLLLKDVKKDEIDLIKRLVNCKFKYEDYKDIYESIELFNKEITNYKIYINKLANQFIRMDYKLDVDSDEYLYIGLNNLKKCIKNNKRRNEYYELVHDFIDIIFKYYGKKFIRKNSIRKNKKYIILLIIECIVSIILFIIYLFTNNINFYSINSVIYIIILVIINKLLLNKNNDELINKINYDDKKIIENYKNKEFRKEVIDSDIYDFFEFLQFDCEDFLEMNDKITSYSELKGKLKKYSNSKYKEFNKELDESKKIIKILFKYYDEEGKLRRNI